jgi:hypothetical protein
MPFLVSRTDTGQFVLTDPATDTVVIDDDLSAGFDKLEQVVADKPARPPAPAGEGVPGDAATQGSSAFTFRGGRRYTPALLAVVLPFVWLAVLYLALANLLSEHALDRAAARDTEARIEELERELQALRSEIAGAPRTNKSMPTRKSKSKPKPKPTDDPAETEAAAEAD